MIDEVAAKLNERGIETVIEYPGVVHIVRGNFWTSDCNSTWTIDKLDDNGNYVDSVDSLVPSTETDASKIVNGLLKAIGRCERCGSEKPTGQSCGCFDNGCQ